MARTPVRITDLSTETAQITNTVPASTTFGLVVRSAGTATVNDDFTTFLSTHFTIAASSGRAINLSTAVRMYRVSNWSTGQVLLVKATSIPSDTDASASRIGKASAANIPNGEVYPITSTRIWVRSAGSHAVSVEAFR